MITAPYLLVLNMPLFLYEGRYWADPLWRKDLLLHLIAVERLSLACPIRVEPPPDDWLPLAEPRIRVVPLPGMHRHAVRDLPAVTWRLWRAIGATRIVHTGIAGWPFPLGWIAAPMARLRRRFLIAGVESSFWRVPAGTAASRAGHWRAALFERLSRFVLTLCDMTFFTTEEYRRSMLRTPRASAHVTPASWVDADQLVDLEALGKAWAAKDGRLLFAGRLTEAKGVRVLLAALERSLARVDLVGQGDLAGEVRAFAATHADRVRLLDPVPYGDAFSAMLDRYGALIVPTLSEEQPRILFDAFARGVPAIASDTSGNRQLVCDGVEGRLVPVGDATALADALDAAAADRDGLEAMGRRARATMDARTHEGMHRERGALIEAALRAGRR